MKEEGRRKEARVSVLGVGGGRNEAVTDIAAVNIQCGSCNIRNKHFSALFVASNPASLPFNM